MSFAFGKEIRVTAAAVAAATRGIAFQTPGPVRLAPTLAVFPRNARERERERRTNPPPPSSGKVSLAARKPCHTRFISARFLGPRSLRGLGCLKGIHLLFNFLPWGEEKERKKESSFTLPFSSVSSGGRMVSKKHILL